MNYYSCLQIRPVLLLMVLCRSYRDIGIELRLFHNHLKTQNVINGQSLNINQLVDFYLEVHLKGLFQHGSLQLVLGW